MINRGQPLEMRQTWKPPRELAASCPRSVRLTAAGVALRIVTIVVAMGAVAAGVLLTVKAARDAARVRLIAQGPTAEARITRLWRTKSDDRTCMVDYVFDAAGHPWQRSAPVRCSDWKTLATGDPARVQFASAHPEMSRLVPLEHSRVLPYWLAPFVSISLAGAAAALVIAMRRERRLLEEGRPAPAIITGARRHKHEHGNDHMHARYEFITLSGSKVRGRYHTDSKLLPEIGSTITVLYLRDEPRRNARYPLSLYRTP